MAVIGTATLNVVPKLSGLSAAVEEAFADVRAEDAGQSMGQRVSGGLMRSGAAVGAFAALTDKALGAVASRVGDAVSRFDTLNNYPKVMESLGYSVEDAEASIGKMSDRLQGLPTTLDSMVSLTQGLVTNTGDLGRATDAALALNDMLVASGSGQQMVNAAQEQFRQILAKGKPEMEDWRSLTTAAPGQMDQLAKSMLGPTANANDLYRALGGGGGAATHTMDDFLDAIIRLDTEGGEGFASFQDQAETAAGGVETSMANLGNAVTRGITSVMDTVGKDNIAAVFNDLKGAVNEAFGVVNKVVGASMPALKGVYEVVRELAPGLAAGAGTYAVASRGIQSIGGAALNVAGRMDKAGKTTGAFAKVAGGLSKCAGPLAAGLGIAGTVVGLIADRCEEARQKQETMTKATTGLNDAVSRAAGLAEYRGKVDVLGTSAGTAALSVEDLTQSIADSVDAMNEISAAAEEQMGALDTAQQIIHDSVGNADLSADAQGRLEWALQKVNEQFGLSITAQDVLNGKYTDQDGAVQDLTGSLDKLIEARKREIQLKAMEQQYDILLKNQSDAAATYAEKKKARDDAQAKYDAIPEWKKKYTNSEEFDNLMKATDELNDAKGDLDNTTQSVRDLEQAMGDAARVAEGGADAVDGWAENALRIAPAFRAIADQHGGFVNLKDDMRSLGVDTAALANLTDGELEAIAGAYDGTELSLARALSGIEGALSDGARAAFQSAMDIRGSFANLDIEGDLSSAGLNLNDFATACAGAGVSIEDLERVGTEGLRTMARECGGSIDEMIRRILEWDGTPMEGKDAEVRLDFNQLVDAQGRVYTWNNGKLEDKDGNVAMDDTQLVDAQGRVYIWNDGELKDKDGNVDVEHDSLIHANGQMQTFNNTELKPKHGKVFIQEIVETVQTATSITNAVNGIFGQGNAAGGIRPHADGGIATRAVPLDIVGEAGAEAIVPLTNRRYAEPFARIIAEEVRKLDGGGRSVANYYIDGRALAVDAQVQAALGKVGRAMRRRSRMRG